MDEYYRAVKALPAWLAALLAQLPAQTAVRVQELRLRIGCAVTFTVQGRQCAASVLPGCPPALAAMRLDALQIEEIFYTLCNGSVHTHERELAEGYLTTAAGNRVGVAGQFVQREGQSIALQKVTSLNLRIARSCAICLPPELDKLLEQHFTGLLVVGEPGSGKTTLLRTIAQTPSGSVWWQWWTNGVSFSRRSSPCRRWSALAGWIKPVPSRWRCARWHRK